jgi:hypothetical protein
MAPRLLVQLTEVEHAAALDQRLEPIEALIAQLCAAQSVALKDRAGLAQALSCSVKTLDRLREEPGFPELMLLDSPRFELAEVLRWLRARNAAPGLRAVDGGKK